MHSFTRVSFWKECTINDAAETLTNDYPPCAVWEVKFLQCFSSPLSPVSASSSVQHLSCCVQCLSSSTWGIIQCSLSCPLVLDLLFRVKPVCWLCIDMNLNLGKPVMLTF